jgi:hypothetical protein
MRRAKIVHIFKKIQPFEGKEEWYVTFNSLVNKNKYRYLSPQIINEQTVISNIDEKGQTLVQFPHWGKKDSENVKIDVTALYQEKQLPIPGYLTFNWISFIFTELNKHVMPTLMGIQEQAEQLINELEKITFKASKIET